jgi:hypothetical protein
VAQNLPQEVPGVPPPAEDVVDVDVALELDEPPPLDDEPLPAPAPSPPPPEDDADDEPEEVAVSSPHPRNAHTTVQANAAKIRSFGMGGCSQGGGEASSSTRAAVGQSAAF